MSDVRIIAEAAQGYLPLVGRSGALETALLLTKAAAVAGADAVKFQIVFVDELAQPGNVHYDIFRRLEMLTEDWATVREFARESGIDFIADVFGARSLQVGRDIDADGYKIHSTSFFDHAFVRDVVATGREVFVSLGGIQPAEVDAFLERHGKAASSLVLLYGFQAEPTPIEMNHLARIEEWRRRTGLEVGFMDHSEGGTPEATALSLLAMGMGVRLFEKHVTLDRELALEDYVSAATPGELKDYVSILRGVAPAVGRGDLVLGEAELSYREKAIKRCVAARDLAAGQAIEAEDIEMIRTEAPYGAFDPQDVVGRTLATEVARGAAIGPKELIGEDS